MQSEAVSTVFAWIGGVAPAFAQGVDLQIPIDTPSGVVSAVNAQGEGGVLFTYMSIVFQWFGGIAGLILLVAIIWYGFLLMFSPFEDKQKEAKQGLTAAIAGFVFLMSIGLLLYTLNPNFYKGFGAECAGGDCGTVIGPAGTDKGDAGSGDSNERPNPNEPRVPDTPSGKRVCTEVSRVDCGVPQEIRALAGRVRKNPKIVLNTHSSTLPGSDPMANVMDLEKGMCPGVQTGVDSNTCEKNTKRTRKCEERPLETTKKYIGNAAVSLAGLERIAEAGLKVQISALYGGQHACTEHRQLRGFDISVVDGVGVSSMSGRAACDIAKKIKSATRASTVLGPASMGSSCGGGVKGDGGHNDHFHVAWSPGAGLGAGLTTTGAIDENEGVDYGGGLP